MLKKALAASALALGAGSVLRLATSNAGAQQLPLTPACVDDDDVELTPAQTEGPYFTPNSPERSSLIEEGMLGTPLTVTGYVLSSTCQPVAGVLLDFWQADDAGEYDNVGFRLRGHQFTDSAGRYSLETIVPGLYPGRTRHIHLKVQAPNAPVLTTQLYFPADAARNARDGIYSPDLLMDVREDVNGQVGRFDFVVATA
jgi:protocatechuate 3,4-dioxygenase beta subunit